MKLKWLIFAATALAMGSFAACTRTNQKPAGPPEKVTIAISATTDSVLAQIAQAKGFYREEGVEATVHNQPYGKLALQEVLDGRADFATVAETPVMLEIMRGAELSIVATIESSRKANVIVARKDRGILAIGDLRGKKVAFTKGTSSDYFLDAVLASNGIARDDIGTVDMKAEETPAALASDGIDAISTFITYAVPAQRRLGERGVTFNDENVYTFTFNLIAKQEFVRKRPATVGKILRALVKAEEFVRRNPDEAQQTVARFSGVDIATVRDIWNDMSFRVSLDQVLVLALEDESRWAIRNRLTGASRVPNYLDYIYLDGLRTVRPEAVRIMR